MYSYIKGAALCVLLVGAARLFLQSVQPLIEFVPHTLEFVRGYYIFEDMSAATLSHLNSYLILVIAFEMIPSEANLSSDTRKL